MRCWYNSRLYRNYIVNRDAGFTQKYALGALGASSYKSAYYFINTYWLFVYLSEKVVQQLFHA